MSAEYGHHPGLNRRSRCCRARQCCATPCVSLYTLRTCRGKTLSRIFLVAIVVWILQASSALAFDPAYPLAGPLRVGPDVLKTGVTLPGDGEPVPCPVQTDFSTPLALGEAVDLALCNNPQIKSSWANIKIQARAVGEARAAYLPTLTGALGRTKDRIEYSHSPASSTIDRNTAQMSLTWRLLDFGGRAANHQASESLLTAPWPAITPPCKRRLQR